MLKESKHYNIPHELNINLIIYSSLENGQNNLLGLVLLKMYLTLVLKIIPVITFNMFISRKPCSLIGAIYFTMI